ncbi:MAG: helicase-related protein [Ignavibacteria bacterium]|nr:helicase-related protein [Ignavibacteria bacterium]
MGNFITNSSEKNLRDRLKTLIDFSREMKFLVGFFYFSGIKELYESLLRLDDSGKLKQETLKILVGLNVDKGAWGIYECSKNQITPSNKNELKSDFLDSLVKAFSSEELDTEEVHNQVNFFIKLLKEKKLVLRKTRQPNHSKLYLFKIDENSSQLLENVLITGSSNLTKAGLESQGEFNVEIKDYGFGEAEQFFNELWRNSINLNDSIDEIIKVLKNETFFREISPYEAYAYILKTYVDFHKAEIEKELKNFLEEKGYKYYNYQIEAVSQAVQNCLFHNGTLLADVVGLGKTVVACLVARSLGKRGLVICPPHLIGNENKEYGWKKYIDDFELSNWEVRSLGKLEETLNYVKAKNFEVVIVDEAHRFRNERTESYHYLREICRGKIVILLTATPFNNKPSDIYSLLKLFNIPKKSTIVYDENLFGRFKLYERKFERLSYILRNIDSPDIGKRKTAKKYYESIFGNDNSIDKNKIKENLHLIAQEIRSLIEPVTIRRNRLDLEYYGDTVDFPIVNDPMEVFFELTTEQSSYYDQVINTFMSREEGGKYSGAIYYPERYKYGEMKNDNEGDDETKKEHFTKLYQSNLYDFMRRLLVRRFESSFGAFNKSLENFIDIHQIVLDFVSKHNIFILDRKTMEKVVNEEDEDKAQEYLDEFFSKLQNNKIDPRFSITYDLDEIPGFLDDVELDLKLFQSLLNRFKELKLDTFDPKAEKLVEQINNWITKKRKVVIFSEFLDTVAYLEKILEKHFRNILLPAYGNLSKRTIDSIYENFDAQYKFQKDEFKILLTTDKLSEGFNLNLAGVVINYDIPWNPVRVIQRLGRINRIGKKVYDEIYIQHFFPTEKGADIINSRNIAQNKMFMIHKVLGEDAKIFSPDEEPKPSLLYQRLTTLPEEEKTESFFTRIRRDLQKIKDETPYIFERIKTMPNRVKVAKPSNSNELMVFVRKGKDIFVGYKDYGTDSSPSVVTFQSIYEKICAQKDTPSLPLSANFWKEYCSILQKRKSLEEFTSTSQSLQSKANNVLKTITKINDALIAPHNKFISDLLYDIESFGTLSDFTLQEIIKWEKYLQSNNFDKLVQSILELKSQIGEDFLQRILMSQQDLKDEIIVAIENQNIEAKNDTESRSS